MYNDFIKTERYGILDEDLKLPELPHSDQLVLFNNIRAEMGMTDKIIRRGDVVMLINKALDDVYTFQVV